MQCFGKGYRRQRGKLRLDTWTPEAGKVKTGHFILSVLTSLSIPSCLPPPTSSLPSFLHFLLASFYFASLSLILGFLQNVIALLHTEEKTIRSKPVAVEVRAAPKTNRPTSAQTTFKTF